MAFRRVARYTRNRGQTANATRRPGAKIRRRIWRKKPTARNQQKQIAGNAMQISRIYKHIKAQRIYTDYQLTDQKFVAAGGPGGQYSLSLSNPQTWANFVLRQDPNVIASQRTFALRMQLNMKVTMSGTSPDSNQPPEVMYWSLFILRARSTQAVNLPVNLIAGDDYIDNVLNEGQRIRMNSGKWKVVASKYITLNSFPAWKAYYNWQWNIKLNHPINGQQPQEDTWRRCTERDIPYYHRYFLWCIPYRANPAETGYALDTNGLYTCLNYA